MKPAVIRPWAVDDFDRLERTAQSLSPDTLALRFHGGLPALPPSYLRTVRARWHESWEAVAAVRGDRLLGWAEYGLSTRRAGDLARADVAVCIVDAEQGAGLGTALLAAILARAAADGLRQVHVDIAHENVRALRAWRAVTGSAAATVPLVPGVAA